MLLTKFHAKLTKRARIFSLTELVELLLILSAVVVGILYKIWTVQPNTVIGVDDNATYDARFKDGVQTIVCLLWLRLFLILSNTRIAGPTMRILKAMLSQLLEFLFIWSMVVVCFSINALLMFGEMKEFTTLTQSLI